MSDDKISLTVVAYVDDKLIGTASLFVSDMEERPQYSPWLAALIVKELFRKRGVAAKLMEEINRNSTKLRFNHCYLYTANEENFYAKRGWNVMERRHYGGEEIVIMKK